MIVRISIERVPEENEEDKAEELVETNTMPYGTGTTAATFDYDPSTKNVFKYLFDLQETFFQLMRHELNKARMMYEIQETGVEDNAPNNK